MHRPTNSPDRQKLGQCNLLYCRRSKKLPKSECE